MALVPYHDIDDLDPEHRSILERPINLFRALANEPDGAVRFHQYAEWIRWDLDLDARTRELLILAVGYVGRDSYEWSHHVVLARQFGVTDEQIAAVVDYAEGRECSLSDSDQLVIEVGIQLAVDAAIDDSTWARVHEVYDARGVTGIVLVASFYTGVLRVLGGLRIDVEPEFAPALEDFPLPTEPYVRR